MCAENAVIFVDCRAGFVSAGEFAVIPVAPQD